ncbi:D-alanyl-D-alanine carboxypeptidase [Halomonas binhaiensis]|uniref:D-alanyl-D-alanine carboxypeptidase n=1 Tax=Halomonas binhaiensis TaxID=2562282 RepID=A0A5C1NIQ2_9GAMM|nr:D-alanyl-D-alanine carboxypeptidase [Halomonas binhaiensis]QEM83592.1 D-alanyl-D-alanine carboxypeptidase [Halomonas binhaiensis]
MIMVSARSTGWRSATSLILALVASLVLSLASGTVWANPRYAGIVVDAETNEILYAENADEPRYPASLTKMMTLYMLFEALESGSKTMTTPLAVSSHAASMPATKLWLKSGQSIPVEKAIEAMVVRSANDVAVVVGESLGGTESQFASMMTRKAQELGMRNTTFRNASGLPDDGQRTTARDMAILSMHLIRDFPQYYHYFALTEFTWKGTRHTGHNRLLKNYPGTDGLKTGFIRASGFNVATSSVHSGKRMVAVVMGGYTAASRDEQMMSVLDRGFMRASLLNGRGFLADTNFSGGELMESSHGFQPATPSRQIQVASVSSTAPATSAYSAAATTRAPANTAVQPSRVERVVQPATSTSSYASTTPSYSSSASYASASGSSSTYGSSARYSSSSASSTSSVGGSSGSSAASDPLRQLIDRPSVASTSPPASTYSTPTAGRSVAVASAAPATTQSQPSVQSQGQGDWGVQVGAFSNADHARVQASEAAEKISSQMANARVSVARADSTGVYRARVVDLQENQARSACQSLQQQGMDCMVVQASL